MFQYNFHLTVLAIFSCLHLAPTTFQLINLHHFLVHQVLVLLTSTRLHTRCKLGSGESVRFSDLENFYSLSPFCFQTSQPEKCLTKTEIYNFSINYFPCVCLHSVTHCVQDDHAWVFDYIHNISQGTTRKADVIVRDGSS